MNKISTFPNKNIKEQHIINIDYEIKNIYTKKQDKELKSEKETLLEKIIEVQTNKVDYINEIIQIIENKNKTITQSGDLEPILKYNLNNYIELFTEKNITENYEEYIIVEYSKIEEGIYQIESRTRIINSPYNMSIHIIADEKTTNKTIETIKKKKEKNKYKYKISIEQYNNINIKEAFKKRNIEYKVDIKKTIENLNKPYIRRIK